MSSHVLKLQYFLSSEQLCLVLDPCKQQQENLVGERKKGRGKEGKNGGEGEMKELTVVERLPYTTLKRGLDFVGEAKSQGTATNNLF